MPIARLPTDRESEAQGFGGPESQRRRTVLRETLLAFERSSPPNRYQELARSNLARWKLRAETPTTESYTPVLQGDWGEVTAALTRQFGICFAVLNMANAYYPGGAYGEGAVAQEENMFRRTDCHFKVRADQLTDDGRTYTDRMVKLLSAHGGAVYLDTDEPRVCIRGPEDRTRDDLGYSWLADADVFPFYELRASAQDLRGGSHFSVDEARRRIAAQLDTLIGQGVWHAVLGAFGCGAFRNPASTVAKLYREEIERRSQRFSVIAFAIFNAGYGPDNFSPFKHAFETAG
jgi:hypothetical protein